MKQFIFALMGLMVITFAACSADSDYDEGLVVKSKVPSTPKDTIPTQPKDTTSTKGWGTPVKNNLVAVGEPSANSHLWNGVMVFYCGADSLVRTTDQTVEFSLTPSTGFSSAKTSEPATYTGSSSISSTSQNTTYGEWYEDAQGNKLRKVTMTAEVKTTEFSKTLVMSRRDASCVVDGREHAFKSHNMSATFKSLDVVETKEVERNDSIFEQKTYNMKFNCTFAVSAQNRRTYAVEATHTVESFLRLVEKKEETMPDADLYVGKLIKATDVVASPRFTGTGSNAKISKWHKTSLVEDETSYHIWVDGKFVRSVKKSTLASGNYNAAMLDGETWVPCLCKPDGKNGFIYTVEFANGSYKIQTVDENLALSSGLKNFTKDNVASQTPFVKTVREQKTYNGKAWLKLTCYNVDGKPTLSYTVAEK